MNFQAEKFRRKTFVTFQPKYASQFQPVSGLDTWNILD